MLESLSAILQTLKLAPGILNELARSIPVRETTAVRRPGFWSIRDHVLHLADAQPRMHDRFVRFRDEAHPEFIPFLPDSNSAPKPALKLDTIDEALAAFAQWRERTVVLLESMPDGYWGKVGAHPEYAAYTPFILVRHLMMHDHWHMYRIEELWLTKDEYLTALE